MLPFIASAFSSAFVGSTGAGSVGGFSWVEESMISMDSSFSSSLVSFSLLNLTLLPASDESSVSFLWFDEMTTLGCVCCCCDDGCFC